MQQPTSAALGECIGLLSPTEVSLLQRYVPTLLAKIWPCWDEDGDLCGQQYRHGIAIDDVYVALVPEIVDDPHGDEEIGAGVEKVSWQIRPGKRAKAALVSMAVPMSSSRR